MYFQCSRLVYDRYFVHFLAVYLQCTCPVHHPLPPVTVDNVTGLESGHQNERGLVAIASSAKCKKCSRDTGWYMSRVQFLHYSGMSSGTSCLRKSTATLRHGLRITRCWGWIPKDRRPQCREYTLLSMVMIHLCSMESTCPHPLVSLGLITQGMFMGRYCYTSCKWQVLGLYTGKEVAVRAWLTTGTGVAYTRLFRTELQTTRGDEYSTQEYWADGGESTQREAGE